MCLEHWQAGILTLSLGRLLQCFTMLLVKKYFPCPVWAFSGAVLNRSYASYHWIPGGRDQHLSLHFHSSGSIREEWGHPFSPNQRSPKPLLLSIVLFQPWQSCVGLYRCFTTQWGVAEETAPAPGELLPCSHLLSPCLFSICLSLLLQSSHPSCTFRSLDTPRLQINLRSRYKWRL